MTASIFITAAIASITGGKAFTTTFQSSQLPSSSLHPNPAFLLDLLKCINMTRFVEEPAYGGGKANRYTVGCSIIHCLNKNAPTLAGCSFDKHGLILIIFGIQHQHSFKNDIPIQISLSLHLYLLYLLSNSSDGNDAMLTKF